MESRLVLSIITISNSLSSSKVFTSIITRIPEDMVRSQKILALIAPTLCCDDISIKRMNRNEGCLLLRDFSNITVWKGPMSNGIMLWINSKGAAFSLSKLGCVS